MKRSGVWVNAALASAPALALTGCVVATSGDTDGNGGAFIVLLLPLILVFGVMTLRRIGRRGPRSRAAPQSARPSTAMLRAELSVLADDIMRFEPRVTLNPAAGDDFDSATHRYRVAQAAMDEAPDDIDLVRVQRVVDEATWSMARARAIVEGRTPPQPPVRLQRPGRHGEPAIGLDDDHHPTYVGSNAPYRSGWFTLGGGLFGGLLVGTMLDEYGGWVTDDGTSGADPDDGLQSGDMEW